MDKLEEARKLRIWDKAVEKVTNLTYELNTEQNSHEEIQLALEDLTKAVGQLNKFWKEKLQESEK